jgi:hypothetical protein
MHPACAAYNRTHLNLSAPAKLLAARRFLTHFPRWPALSDADTELGAQQ